MTSVVSDNSNQSLLKLESLFLKFGGVHVLTDVSLEVYSGEIFSIIGPNGAGKTCLLNCVNRFYHPEKGRLFFEGQDITKRKTHDIAALGIARTFQKRGTVQGDERH